MSENQRFSDVFRGYRNVALAGNGLTSKISIKLLFRQSEVDKYDIT